MTTQVTAVAIQGRDPVRPPPPAELDEITLARAQRGDARARRNLVERYQRPVFALLSRMLPGRGRHVLEDLAQDTFLRVFRALAGFDRNGRAKLSTWILTITTNLAIDHMRRSRRDDAPLEPELELADPSTTDADAERRRLAAVLRRAIDDLSPEHRAAFLLREYHEFDYAEIASTLQIDLGTVKSRLSRARAALRRSLEEVYHAR